MRKLYVVICLLCCNSIFSQIEIGIITGTMGYVGDLSPQINSRAQPDIHELNLSAGLIRRVNLNRRFSFRTNLLIGKISGTDIHAIDPMQQNRGLHFRSRIYEGAALLEWNLLDWVHGERREGIAGVSSPYFFVGLGAFYFNPQALHDHVWVDLQPLGTEGQFLQGSRKKIYSRLQLNIPMGFGFKYAFSQHGAIGFEIGLRKTFTDYLDDVSGNYPHLRRLESENPLAAQMSYKGSGENNPSGLERGDSTKNDWYFFAGVAVTVNLKKDNSLRVKRKRKRRHRYE